jgi:hypothetical protein
LVERVALMTAKRSTSRSWVRAPPSAIPISKSQVAAVLLLFFFSSYHVEMVVFLSSWTVDRSVTHASVRKELLLVCLFVSDLQLRDIRILD